MRAIMIMVSPDKKMLVISNFDKLDSENKTYKSSIYTLPNGGTPKLITKRLLIGMVGVQMARHWHIVQNEMGILIFTQYVDGGEEKKIDNI
jgi:hypothetical protein